MSRCFRVAARALFFENPPSQHSAPVGRFCTNTTTSPTCNRNALDSSLLSCALTLPLHFLLVFLEMPRRCTPVRQNTAMSSASPRGRTSPMVRKNFQRATSNLQITFFPCRKVLVNRLSCVCLSFCDSLQEILLFSFFFEFG